MRGKGFPDFNSNVSENGTAVNTDTDVETKHFGNGEKQLIFKKKIGDEYLVTTMVSNRKKRLIVQSLYITKKESAGTQPRHASLETLRFTSETRTGDTDFSTNNVNKNGTAVKPMLGMSEQKPTGKRRRFISPTSRFSRRLEWTIKEMTA